MEQSPQSIPVAEPVQFRIERTLELMHRWGYAPTIDALAKDLIGGSLPPDDLRDATFGTAPITLADPFICLRGYEHLIAKSRDRIRTNRIVNGRAKAIATAFALDLVRSCPTVQCVALSGSLASDGYVPTDDIDLDLFVSDGTKYMTYALCLALGFIYSLRHVQDGHIRKLICINVLWTREQSSPFERQDIDMAFELLRCKPLVGSAHFREAIRVNGWAMSTFPQLASRSDIDLVPPGPNLLGRLLGWIVARPPLLQLADRIGRILSFEVYRIIHWMRRADRDRMERLAFLMRAKHPYEVFQD